MHKTFQLIEYKTVFTDENTLKILRRKFLPNFRRRGIEMFFNSGKHVYIYFVMMETVHIDDRRPQADAC